MKYLFCLLLVCCGCQNGPSELDYWIKPNGKIKVLSTTAIIDDLVGQIGGDRIDHLPLIGGAIDPHSYELVKGDDEKLSYAQIIFYNGLGLEHGASLKYRLERHPNARALGDLIREKKPELILYADKQTDPHIWLDIALWAESIEPIVTALSEIDPSSKEYFEANGQKAKTSLLEMDLAIEKKLAQIPAEKRYLVTSHDAFNYFARRYLGGGINWKERFCAPEGLAPDGQLSARDIQMVINHLLEHQIHVIFPESNVSRDSIKKIVSVCQEKGFEIRIAEDQLFSDTLGTPGSTSDTYLKMMEHNGNVLEKAWEK